MTANPPQGYRSTWPEFEGERRKPSGRLIQSWLLACALSTVTLASRAAAEDLIPCLSASAVSKAEALESTWDLSGAESALRSALKSCNPTSVEANRASLWLGELLVKQERYTDALVEFQRIAGNRDIPRGLIQSARKGVFFTLLYSGRPDDALATFKSALESDGIETNTISLRLKEQQALVDTWESQQGDRQRIRALVRGYNEAIAGGDIGRLKAMFLSDTPKARFEELSAYCEQHKGSARILEVLHVDVRGASAVAEGRIRIRGETPMAMERGLSFRLRLKKDGDEWYFSK